MHKIEYSGSFKKDMKLAQKRGKDIDKIKEVIKILALDEPIPEKYKDYALTGNWKNYRDIHIESDWLLIYLKNDTTIRFERTGSHSDIF